MARSEAQKKADKNYEEKRKGKRARAWTTVCYPDSAPENFEEILRDELVECLISPLHDKDKNPDDGTQKKPHWHVVVSFKNPKSKQHAQEVFDKINGVGIQKVKDFAQLARYLCHLDHPNKYQYDPEDVVTIGAIDYRSLIMSGADEDEMLDAIFEMMDERNLVTYSQVVRFCRDEKPEWRCLVYRKYTRQISEFAKGKNFELTHGIEQKSAKNGGDGGDITPSSPPLFCSKCGSVEVVKNGKKRGKQRFLCKDCGHRFV